MTAPDLARLGNTIRARRLQLDLTQERAAELAEVDIKTWQAIERGKRTPRKATAAAIERALCWAPGWVTVLLSRIPRPDPNPGGPMYRDHLHSAADIQAAWAEAAQECLADEDPDGADLYQDALNVLAEAGNDLPAAEEVLAQRASHYLRMAGDCFAAVASSRRASA